MRREVSVFAYQLEVGMWIFMDGIWRKVKSLKGTFLPGRGLTIDVELSVGVVQVPATYALSARYGK